MRGRLVRLRLEKIKNLLKQNDQTGEFDDTIPESAFFFNQRVKEVYDREGPFQVEVKPAFGIKLVLKPPFRMRSKVIYQGQWTEDLISKHGKGR